MIGSSRMFDLDLDLDLDLIHWESATTYSLSGITTFLGSPKT